MVHLDEARERVLAACAPLPPRRLPLADALGLVTTSDIFSLYPVPTFANSAMDGFAVRAADTAAATVAAPVRLAVVSTIAAGSPPVVPTATGEVGPGQAVRIMTGAPVPPGADAVVMVENTRSLDGGATVEVAVPASGGDHVRRAGEDIAAGQLVFPAGTQLAPGHLGVLASVGCAVVDVRPPARVGVLSTGDELVGDSEHALRPGQIRDSNRPMLLALARQAGAEPVDLGYVADDETAITEALTAAVARCDLVVSSGGVSVGDYDYVKAVLARMGPSHSWQVAIKPAKPLAFAVAVGTPVLGLPGNPVSAMVAFELFARPAVRRLMGHADVLRPTIPAVAGSDLRRRPDGKLHLLRVVATVGADGRHHVVPSGGQGSHQLWAMAHANALALLPDGEGVRAGDPLTILLLG